MKNARPEDVGIDSARLERLFEAIERMVAEKWMYGGSFLVARRGRIVAARGIGMAEPARRRASKADDVYCIFSTTKPLTGTLLLMQVERGRVRLTDRVAEHVPEFGVAGKENVTISQVLTHTAGFAALAPDWAPQQWGDWDATIQRICAQPVEHEPGARVDYHALTGSWILAEIVRRADGGQRSFAEIAAADLYGPLGMKDSHMGVRPDMAERRVPIQALDHGGFPFPPEFLELFNLPELQRACIPGGGSHSTVFDLARFYQMWLDGGVLGGEGTAAAGARARLLSPAMVTLATTNHTGDAEDRLMEVLRVMYRWPRIPANRGLSFWIRGNGIFPTVFGSLASPRTFGHPGAGSTMAWADPERDLIFVGLTAGVLTEERSILRFHTLSDLVQAAAID